MIAKIYSAIPHGYSGAIVEVEGDSNHGLPGLNIVGMANKTISEARERVRAALSNSGYSIPPKKITISLAPAELEKSGSQLDLPIALAILVLSGKISKNLILNRLFVGELSLNGDTRPIRGIINIVEAAKISGYKQVFIPYDNLNQAKLISGIEIIGVKSLIELILILSGVKNTSLEPNLASKEQQHNVQTHLLNNSIADNNTILLEHIKGQDLAKRALIIAIAGHHNLLLSGPPGAGKSMLAHAAHTLIPPPSPTEQIAISKIYSLFEAQNIAHLNRPFRAPHHTASSTSIIGGGISAIPDEVSLANAGILYLDELPEFSKNTIESLRQPLEDGEITISRANYRFTYPAKFILIATMNPCPCGYYGDTTHDCSCTATQIDAYRKKISGPILDRIDTTITVERVKTSDLTNNEGLSLITTTEAKEMIEVALKQQYNRYNMHNRFNDHLSSRQAMELLKIAPSAKEFLNSAADKLNLSARAYFKTIKVAQTIADLTKIDQIYTEQISEALSFRQQIQ